MTIVLSFILALSLSTLALPALMRNAAAWRLLDAPDARKHHVGLIPRVGGIAIALGTLLSATIWTFADSAYVGFLLGSIVIVLFGFLDDRSNLDFRIKFGGQIIAALIVAAFGIRLSSLPFVDHQVIAAAVVPITVFFLLAATNAFNLLDGLDGLAAGCGILSLAVIGVLALTSVDGGSVVFVAAAALGGVLGFLRYNTHPAIVYMGDAGSQFIGFAIGSLALLLIERSGGALSPVLVLPILGLPIIDTALVMIIRIRAGRSPFSPDRHHIHHRLLSLGLSHREAVATIYLAQTTLVASAIVFRKQPDPIILGAYGAICLISAVGYFLLVRRHEGRIKSVSPSRKAAADQSTDNANTAAETLKIWLVRYVSASLLLYLVVGTALLDTVTPDIAVIALCCAVLTIVFWLWARFVLLATRLATYLAVVYVSYLSGLSAHSLWIGSLPLYLWIGSVALAIAVLAASKARDVFKPSTQDLLTILVVLAIVAMPAIIADKSVIAGIAVRAMVFLYACELLITLRPRSASMLALPAILSLVMMATLHTAS